MHPYPASLVMIGCNTVTLQWILENPKGDLVIGRTSNVSTVSAETDIKPYELTVWWFQVISTRKVAIQMQYFLIGIFS